MKPKPENFDELKRLLKLKRHETPPPGYFDNFSSSVLAEIKAGNKSSHENLLDWLAFEAPWLGRLLAAFETKPLVSWGTGAAICAVIIGSVIYTQNVEYSPISAAVGVADTGGMKPVNTENPPSFAQPQQEAQSDVNSSNSATGSLFDQIQPQTQPAGWHP